MSEDVQVSPVAEAPVAAPTPVDTTPLTMKEAVGALRERQKAPREEEQKSPERGDGAGESPPTETDQSEEDAAPEVPPVKAPRSWTAEEKAAFEALPREHQQRIAERERAREADIRRVQDETAAERKRALEVQQAAQHARVQYEQALPQAINAIQQQLWGEFPDIQTPDDVTRLAYEDPARYTRWHAATTKANALQQQAQMAHQQNIAQTRQAFDQYAAEQNRIIGERVPELASSDPVVRDKAVKRAVSYLEDKGFKPEEWQRSWMGEHGISIRDARWQEVINDAAMYREAKKTAAKVAAKPLPPVQKPGMAVSKTEARAEKTQALANKLDKTGSLKDAFALYKAAKGSR